MNCLVQIFSNSKYLAIACDLPLRGGITPYIRQSNVWSLLVKILYGYRATNIASAVWKDGEETDLTVKKPLRRNRTPYQKLPFAQTNSFKNLIQIL